MGIERFCIGHLQTVTSTESIPEDLPLEIYEDIVEHYCELPPESRKIPEVIEFNTRGYYVMPEKKFIQYSDPADRFESVKGMVTSKIRETKRSGVSFIAIIVDDGSDGLAKRLCAFYRHALGHAPSGVPPYTSPAYKP